MERLRNSHLRSGVIAAVAVLALDQASKLWLLFVFDIARRGAVNVTPFFDLSLAWNVGISFGWFQNDSQLAQISLMIIKAVAGIFFADCVSPARTPTAPDAPPPFTSPPPHNTHPPSPLRPLVPFPPC